MGTRADTRGGVGRMRAGKGDSTNTAVAGRAWGGEGGRAGHRRRMRRRALRGCGSGTFFVIFLDWFFLGVVLLACPGYGGGLLGTLALEARRGGSGSREGGGGDGARRDAVGEI